MTRLYHGGYSVVFKGRTAALFAPGGRLLCVTGIGDGTEEEGRAAGAYMARVASADAMTRKGRRSR